MILNDIACWRAKANNGEGISRAHLARRVGVGRSFITKLEKGVAQPGAELMLRIAAYFKQPVESIFWFAESATYSPSSERNNTIPGRQPPITSKRVSSERLGAGK
jgi:DNA-binding XRE family transcriptional regulator